MKKNKRIFLLIFLLPVLLLFRACKPVEEAGQTMTETETGTTAETTTVPETTPAPTEPPERQASEVKIGMIFYGEETDGSVLTAALREGLLRAAEELGIGAEQILWQYNSREADWTQIEDSILACVENGCQIIFGGAREYASVIAAIAEEYPDVMFACIDSELYNGKNSGTFDISLAAVQYLCGVAAAMNDTTGHIGFLAAKGTADKDVTDAVNAFAYGVWSVNPQAVVETAVTGKWFLPQAEEQAVAYLRELGCQVFCGYTDSSAGLRAAAASGSRILGCGAEETGLYGSDGETAIAAAALYRFGTYFLMKLNQVISRQVTGEAWTGDCYNQAVEFRSAAELPQAAVDQLKAWAPENAAIREPAPLFPASSESAVETLPPDMPESSDEPTTSGLSENAGGTSSADLAESSVEPSSDASVNPVETDSSEYPDKSTSAESSETSAEVTPEALDEQKPAGTETEEPGEPENTDTQETGEDPPSITIDEETGYLENVRVHEIEPEDPEE